jgi:hypothetical protein
MTQSINDAVRQIISRSAKKNGEAREITKIIKQHHEVITLLIEKLKKNLGKYCKKMNF